MKRKILIAILAFVCAITCSFGLAACNNGDEDVSDLFAASSAQAEKQKSVDIGSFVYGGDSAVNEALGNLKFYKKLMNGSYKEVAASDMTVEYKKYDVPLPAKPGKYTAGDYRFIYGVEGVPQTCEAIFHIEKAKATSEDFTATLSKATWKYGDASALAEVKNPSGKVVRVSDGAGDDDSDGSLTENDTVGVGNQFLCIKKSVYDAHPSSHKTFAALTTYEEDATKPNYSYNKYFGKDLLHYSNQEKFESFDFMGEYVLIALIHETYNYKEIVCETEFTITNPESPYGKTFVLTDLSVYGSGGTAAPDEIVTMFAQLKEDNLNKTVVCAQDGAITGTCDFSGGSFDSLQGDDALKLLQFGRDESEYREADPVYVMIKNGHTDTNDQCLLEGQFYGGMLYLRLDQWTDGETPIPYYVNFTFELQSAVS